MPPVLKLDPDLAKQIERARKHVITNDEAHKQRVSYVLGNMPSKSKATAENVEETLGTTHRKD